MSAKQGAPQKLSPIGFSANWVGPEVRTPQIAVGPQGDAVAVWQRGGDRGLIVQAASHEAAGRGRDPSAKALYADVVSPKEVRLMLMYRGDGTPHSRCWVHEVKPFVKGRELFLRHKLIGKRQFVNIDGRSRRFVDIELNRRGRELVRRTHEFVSSARRGAKGSCTTL